MSLNKNIIIGFIVVVPLIVFAYYTISPFWRNVEMHEASPLSEDSSLMPEESKVGNGQGIIEGIVNSADFVPQAHEVAGNAQLILVDNKSFVRFENFKTINGPDLRVYLSTDTTNDDFIDLGPLKATEGSINYEIPTNTDLEKYDTVLVWCRAFRVLFSYASFN